MEKLIVDGFSRVVHVARRRSSIVGAIRPGHRLHSRHDLYLSYGIQYRFEQ